MSSRYSQRLGRREFLALVGGPVAFAVSGIPRAQNLAQGSDWPKGPIRVIVPFPPGGTTDPLARIIQAKLMENTGWQMVVDNKPGAAGAIGAAIAAKSPPDGQTWMVTFDSHILSPAFTPNLPYKDSELFNVMLLPRILRDEVCNRSDDGNPPLELSARTEPILASRGCRR